MSFFQADPPAAVLVNSGRFNQSYCLSLGGSDGFVRASAFVWVAGGWPWLWSRVCNSFAAGDRVAWRSLDRGCESSASNESHETRAGECWECEFAQLLLKKNIFFFLPRPSAVVLLGFHNPTPLLFAKCWGSTPCRRTEQWIGETMSCTCFQKRQLIKSSHLLPWWFFCFS